MIIFFVSKVFMIQSEEVGNFFIWECENLTRPESGSNSSLSCRQNKEDGAFVFWCLNTTSLSPEIYENFEAEQVVILPEDSQNISYPPCMDMDGGDGKTANVWLMDLENDTGSVVYRCTTANNVLLL